VVEEKMDRTKNVTEGMQVYGADNQLLGTVERVHGNGFDVAGQHYPLDVIARVAKNIVYVRSAGMAEGVAGSGTTRTAEGVAGRDTARTATMDTNQTEGEIRVPVAEERLSVGKREVDLGEVGIRKTVTEEEQTASVTLHRDEVNVREVDTKDRPLRAGEDAFEEGTIRVQLRGEEAVVAKEAVVTGEVVVNKETVAREEQVSGTVRKQHVDVDKAYQEARSGFERTHATTAGTSGRTFEQAEPNYRSGFTAAHDERYTDREFEEVEPTLRSEYETRTTRTGGTGTDVDGWEHLRQEVREGWNKARNR
jgi:uncharacterized protein (TIGR02271 family)